MSGGTVVPRHECPGGHFFQGDSHASDNGTGTDTWLPLHSSSGRRLDLSLVRD